MSAAPLSCLVQLSPIITGKGDLSRDRAVFPRLLAFLNGLARALPLKAVKADEEIMSPVLALQVGTPDLPFEKGSWPKAGGIDPPGRCVR